MTIGWVTTFYYTYNLIEYAKPHNLFQLQTPAHHSLTPSHTCTWGTWFTLCFHLHQATSYYQNPVHIIGVFASSGLGVRIFSFTAQKCAWEVRVCKSCTSAVSESEFDHANRILALKSRRTGLYSVMVIKMSRLAIDRLLILWSIHGSLHCCKTDREKNVQLLCP